MRLICTISEKEGVNPYEFSYYLTNQGIENSCDEAKEGGKKVFRIWVVEEDLVDKALEYYADYQKNPEDPRFRAHSHFATPLQKKSFEQKNNLIESPEKNGAQQRSRILSPSPYGTISIAILLAVIFLFIFDHLHRETPKNYKIPGVIQAPFFTKTEKKLLFDYPHYYELRDQLYKIYNPDAPKEAQNLINEIQNTRVWIGLYDLLLNYKSQESLKNYTGPLFEKIRAGEIWRLITPIFLHLDLLHIFFNILWFIVLGNQIEFRLGSFRYILLILITGIFANVAQYFVSGPFFLGLSGVIMGMAAFIWARQQRAPWEGYLLHRFTFIFLAVFVIGMFVLQLVLFFLQLSGTLTLTIGMANTAHLTGAVVGYFLGCLPYFATRPTKKY